METVAAFALSIKMRLRYAELGQTGKNALNHVLTDGS
jgi:hypothetical protein